MSKLTNFVVASAASLTFLSGCGGGGGGDTSSVAVGSQTTANNGAASSTTTNQIVTAFPLQSAYKAHVANGGATSYTISGSCNGSSKYIDSAPASSTFEGSAALAVTRTVTLNFTNCTPASNALTGINYYDSNYNPLGEFVPGVDYGDYPTAPNPLPVSVKIGDTGLVGTANVYTDSSKVVFKGTRVRSYVIENDGASTSTAVVNLITKEYNNVRQLMSTSQARYRIDGSGTITALSIDVQFSTTSTNHFVYTAN